MLNKTFVRVIAVFLAVLMLLGVLSILFNVFAADISYSPQVSLPTGEKHSPVPIIILVGSLIALICCVTLSKRKKNNNSPEDAENFIDENKVEKNIQFFTSKKKDAVIEKDKENKD